MDNQCPFYVQEQGCCHYFEVLGNEETECSPGSYSFNACQQEAARQEEATEREIPDDAFPKYKRQCVCGNLFMSDYPDPVPAKCLYCKRVDETPTDQPQNGEKERQAKEPRRFCYRIKSQECIYKNVINECGNDIKGMSCRANSSPDRRVNEQPTMASYSYPQESEYSYDKRDRRSSRGRRKED